MGAKFKYLSFLYSAYMTNLIRVRADATDHFVLVENLQLIKRPIKRLANLYHNCSTILHLCAASFFLYVRCFQDFNSPTGSNYFMRCYSPRLILGQYIELKNCASITVLMGSLNIIYRCITPYQLYGHENYLVSFLLADEQQFQRSLNTSRTRYTAHQHLPLSRAMFYPFRDPISRKLELRLRPNRDAEARRHLFRLIDVGFDLILVSGLFVTSLYLLSGLAMLLTHQEKLYVGCETTGAFWFLLRNLLSVCMLIVHSLDNLLFLNFSVANLPLFVYDMDRYLARLRARTESLRRKLSQLVHEEQPNQEDEPVRREIADVRANFVDFFAQIRQTDAYVSMLVPFSMFAWLLCNAFLTLSGIQTETGNFAIRLFQCIGFFLSGLISCFVLEFKRRVERLYVPLCSLMAMDLAARNKMRWIPVLMFYTHEEPRYAFTLCGYKLYTRLAYLTYLSYTLTFALFVDSLRTISATGNI